MRRGDPPPFGDWRRVRQSGTFPSTWGTRRGRSDTIYTRNHKGCMQRLTNRGCCFFLRVLWIPIILETREGTVLSHDRRGNPPQHVD